MTMTKKEQAEMERLRHEVALHNALRFPTYPDPDATDASYYDDIPAEAAVERYIVNSHTGKVTRCLVCRYGIKELDTRKKVWLPKEGWDGFRRISTAHAFYCEAFEALRHYRLIRTLDFAEALAGIDESIAAAEAGEGYE